MRKQDLAKVIQNSYYNTQTKVGSEEILELIINTIKEAVKKGEEVKISGFGIFKRQKMNVRIAQNPRTGEKVTIPPHGKVKFIPAISFKELVR